ncbi:branched-chain amino acid ABC transporter permease [Geodermatophilus sabuli]|uniref:Branched-chain amino acid transport system permease protein n=1 Tax=Geodermatophilus sabuli TaxID=1564158 RepID=A0A285EF86_9ACTN|nr:branched-chain amino acid ABC transporter permease [Geodermatophilus sabuli]MBB3086580.1 branched-chain amino acid transport system permease protein [Geodermatophilus sabuli]SNX97768.1 branched-chain amino acid transport system permease protein [Geodermatophilus sabuli]
MAARVVLEGSRAHRLWQGSGLLLAALVVLALPLFVSDFRIGQFSLVIAYAVAVLGLNLVTGFTGQVSLGHGAFFGIGAYTTAILVTDHGWAWAATVPVAALLGLALGFIVGVPALRLHGLYLAVITLAVGVAFPVVVSQPVGIALGTGGVAGKTVQIGWDKPAWFGLDVSDRGWMFLVMAAVAGLLFWLATGLVRSRVGRAMVALRDNGTAAAISGVWPAEVKTVAFAISALYGAVGGSLYLLTTPIVSPTTVGFTITLLFITAMVLGGAATVSGAWLGGLAMVFLPYYTAEWAGQIPLLRSITDQPGLFANVIYGVVLIVFIYFVPAGLVPLLTRLRTRYLVIVPPEAAGVAVPPEAAGVAVPPEAAGVAVPAADWASSGSDTTPGAPDGGLAGPTPAIGGPLSPVGEHHPSDDPGQPARGLPSARGASQEERTR